MNKYRIYASYVVEVYCDVEAESREDAWDNAYKIDGGDYSHPLETDWQIERIEELTE